MQQLSPSLELLQEESPSEIQSTSESIAGPNTSGRRTTRGKDVSSLYSSLIPKSRDKPSTSVFNEPIQSNLEFKSNIKSDIV